MEPPNANLDDGLTGSVVTLTYDREGNQILSPPNLTEPRQHQPHGSDRRVSEKIETQLPGHS